MVGKRGFLLLFLIIIPFVYSLPELHVEGDKVVDEDGNEVMLRGMQFSTFYLLAPDMQFDELNADLTDYFCSDHLDTFRSWGGNVVRITIQLWSLEEEPYVYNEFNLNHLDNMIERYGEKDIYVILDLHQAGQNALLHNSYYGNIIWDDDDFKDRVVALWGVLADRYKDNPAVAGYDILNEPQAPSRQNLHDVYDDIITEIRKYDDGIIVLEIDQYTKVEHGIGGSYDDDNIMTSMHFYKPSQLTKQGLDNNPSDPEYPGTFYNEFIDRDYIDDYFVSFLEHDDLIGKPMFIGEFGVHWPGSNNTIEWVDDVFSVLHKRGLHYTYFNFKTDIGIYGIHLPSEETKDNIGQLVYALRHGHIEPEEVTEEYMMFLDTGGYEYSEDLVDLLKNYLGQEDEDYCGDGNCDENENCSCSDCEKVHDADTDCNGKISMSELIVYVNFWLEGSISMHEVIEIIKLWKE